MIGDGTCNYEANNAKCNFDDGDCLCESVLSEYIGDGNCQDENNNPECQFDGGDCCGSYINVAYCNDCLCLEGGGSNNTGTTIYSNSTNQPGTTIGKYQ